MNKLSLHLRLFLLVSCMLYFALYPTDYICHSLFLHVHMRCVFPRHRLIRLLLPEPQRRMPLLFKFIHQPLGLLDFL